MNGSRHNTWTPWMMLVGVLGVATLALLVTDPGPAETAVRMRPTYYPEPLPRPGYDLVKQRIGKRKIPAYLLSAQDVTEPRPVVILIHGGGPTDLLEYRHPQYKGEWFIKRFEGVPYGLAEAGFLVVAIDNWWAGERYEPRHAQLAQADPIPTIFRAWVETRNDVSSVIDYLLDRDDVDPDRIAVAGKSGGAIISLMTIAKDERVHAALAWKGAPDYLKKIRLRGQELLMGDAVKSNEAFLEELQREDAIYHYQNIPPRHVALIGNWEDPAMPRELAISFEEKLRPHYAEYPDRLYMKFYETPKPTHTLTPEALEEGTNWLVESLQPN